MIQKCNFPAFHPSGAHKMSTRNFWEQNGKKETTFSKWLYPWGSWTPSMKTGHKAKLFLLRGNVYDDVTDFEVWGFHKNFMWRNYEIFRKHIQTSNKSQITL